MTNVFFSGRIPQVLSDHATEFAKALGKNKTEILIEALAQYTGFTLTTDIENPKPLPLLELIEQLQQQVKILQDKLDVHSQKIETIENQFTVKEIIPTVSNLESPTTIADNANNDDNKIEEYFLENLNTEKSSVLDDNSNNNVIKTENIDNNIEPNNVKANNSEISTIITQLELTQTTDYRWQPTNESTMSKLLDINRATLKRHREKIISGTLTLDNVMEGFIDGIPCLIKFCGETGEGNQKRMIWQAVPKSI